jgi:hypothetical protein
VTRGSPDDSNSMPITMSERQAMNSETIRTYLKNVTKSSGQGAGRINSGAYTLVCEHFEPPRNTAMDT